MDDLIEVRPYKYKHKNYGIIKRCPSCNKLYEVKYHKQKGKRFLCSCGTVVLIDKPEFHFFLLLREWVFTTFIVLFLIIIFIGIPGLLIYGLYSCATAPKTESVSQRKTNIDAWVFTQYLVEEYLESPKSAKFPFGGGQNHVEETAPGIFIIRSYVDSQNSFGAMIRTKFFCKLHVKNGKFEVLQLTFD